MNEMQIEKYQNEEIQHYQDGENKLINTNENQIAEFCREHQDKITQIKNPCIALNSNENLKIGVELPF